MKLVDLDKYINSHFENKISNRPGIYCFLCRPTGKFYVGRSKHVEQRKQEHIDELNAGTHHSYKFQKAWNKYGIDSFEFYVIEYSDQLDKLETLEPYWINKLNAVENGLNVKAESYNYDDIKAIVFDRDVSSENKLEIIKNIAENVIGKYFNLNQSPIHSIKDKELYKLINYLHGETISDSILKDALEYLSVPFDDEEAGQVNYYMYDLDIKPAIRKRIIAHNKEVFSRMEIYCNSPIRQLQKKLQEHAMTIYNTLETIEDVSVHIQVRNQIQEKIAQLEQYKSEIEEEIIKIY